jgi:hypothetical protein
MGDPNGHLPARSDEDDSDDTDRRLDSGEGCGQRAEHEACEAEDDMRRRYADAAMTYLNFKRFVDEGNDPTDW